MKREKEISFKVRPTTFSGLYDCGDYQIRLADKSGGKAGRGNNRTSSLQITTNDTFDSGYRIEKQFRFIVGNKNSYDVAEKKCIRWIMAHPRKNSIS